MNLQARRPFLTQSRLLVATLIVLFSNTAYAHPKAGPEEMRFVQIAAKNKLDRTVIANAGVSIEAFRTDSIWGFATPSMLKVLQKKGVKVLGNFDKKVARGGHESSFDFPGSDSRFHNYTEMLDELRALQAANPDLTRLHTIGQSVEGRELFAMQVNTDPNALNSGQSSKPGFVIMGAHHAREHLSVEIPLMFLKHVLSNRGDAQISRLLESRDFWVIPMVNPDGAEFDIATGDYQMWRKNRRNNGNGTYGVDLNRNYGYQWGTGGSSASPSSDTYKGPQPFSEPESQAIKSFIDSHLNIKVLVSVHTFSELILYPWGHKYDGIDKSRDIEVFETMARTMARWNGYKPQQASDLYIASGDTTDWAYGTHGIFAFTFELSPKSMWDGGFYPGQGVIDRVFNANIKPLLYMYELSDDPYRAVSTTPSQWLKNYVEPRLPESAFWSVRPF